MSNQPLNVEETEVEPITRVVFRKFRDTGDIIALMPDSFSDCTNWFHCDSFMLNGGHSGATPLLTRETALATEAEYAATKKVMEGPNYGYKLRVMKRIPKECASIRQAAWRKFNSMAPLTIVDRPSII